MKTTTTQPAPATAETGELLPCPLCGSTDLFLRDIAGWELDCRNCELSLVIAEDPSREGLVQRWNTRVNSHAALLRENEALRQSLRELLITITTSPKSSIGSIDNTYEIQIGVHSELLKRARAALGDKQ